MPRLRATPFPTARPSSAGCCGSRYCPAIRPSLNGPKPTAHEYLSFPCLLRLADENLPEGGVGLAGRVDHLAELGAVGDAPALGLVHVLAGDDVAVLPCVVPERPELCGDGEKLSLYEAFEPAEARRIAERLEIHYTPKHGSWLNMAEIEIGVLARQCLDRRIANQDILRGEVNAWQNQRNRDVIRVDWRSTTEDARIKLKSLYPSIQKSSTSCRSLDTLAVEGCGCVVGPVDHACFLLVSSCPVWRERRICIRSCLRHSLSSR